MSFFSPDYQYETIHDIDFDQLKEMGIKLLLIDIDNTIIPWDSSEVGKKLIDLFEKLKKKNFEVMLFSNARRDRVAAISAKLDVKGVAMALKPLPINYRKSYRRKGLKSKQTAIIGDQVFTDLLGAKIAGVKSILVDPLSEKELKATKVMRVLEKFVRNNSD